MAKEREVADEQRARTREDRRRAQEGYKRAAIGLADVQRGIEELHRRAGAYHQAVRRLHEAEECFGRSPLLPPAFDEHLAAGRGELASVDEERRDAATRLADAESHRQRHAQTMQALVSLVEISVALENAHDIALEALTRHRNNVMLTGRLPSIEQALVEVRRLAARQTKAHGQAAELGVAIGGKPPARLTLSSQLFDEVEGARKNHEEKARIAEDAVGAKERELRRSSRCGDKSL